MSPSPGSTSPDAGGSRLAGEWAQHRPAVFGAAYRITGSVADAEDIVQDVWVRAASAGSLDDVRDLRAWLVTVAARRAYDVLGSAHARRVEYVGPWLPEPLLTGPDAAYTTDGGGRVFAARKVITGAGRIAAVLLRLAVRNATRLEEREVNGRPELLVYRGDRLVAVDTVEVSGGRITALRRVLNPGKLASFRR